MYILANCYSWPKCKTTLLKTKVNVPIILIKRLFMKIINNCVNLLSILFTIFQIKNMHIRTLKFYILKYVNMKYLEFFTNFFNVVEIPKSNLKIRKLIFALCCILFSFLLYFSMFSLLKAWMFFS